MLLLKNNTEIGLKANLNLISRLMQIREIHVISPRILHQGSGLTNCLCNRDID